MHKAIKTEAGMRSCGEIMISVQIGKVDECAPLKHAIKIVKECALKSKQNHSFRKNKAYLKHSRK